MDAEKVAARVKRAWLKRVLVGGHLAVTVAVGAAASLFKESAATTSPSLTPTPLVASSSAPVQEPVAAPTGTPGSQWLKEYAKLDALQETERHRLVLEQVAQRNMPDTWDDWVTVTVVGQKGTVVEFEVSPHGLRIGTTEDWVEVPMDGPHSAAAADILDLRLATAWMVEKTRLQARAQGGVVHFFTACEIAPSMGSGDWQRDASDGQEMKSAEFFGRRSAMIRGWLSERQVARGALVGGYFKSIVPPVDGLTRRRGLEIIGGCSDEGEQIQPLSGGLHARTFFDYSHNIRLTKNVIWVNGKRLTLSEFWDSVKYAREFGFRRTRVPHPAYPYPKALAEWMEARGYAE